MGRVNSCVGHHCDWMFEQDLRRLMVEYAKSDEILRGCILKTNALDPWEVSKAILWSKPKYL